MNWLVVCFALLAVSNSAFAQSDVYLCVDENGKREFKNKGNTAGCKKVHLPGIGAQQLDVPANSIQIKRSNNGHFEIYGKVNGVPVPFLVDTGATAVSVTAEVASQAGLPAGRPINVTTANGKIAGRLLSGVQVSIGSLPPIETEVVVGVAGSGRQALLGQSFLAHFDIQISGDDMFLRRRRTPKQLVEY